MSSKSSICRQEGCNKWQYDEGFCGPHLVEKRQGPREVIPCYYAPEGCKGTVERLVSNKSVRCCTRCRNVQSDGGDPGARFTSGIWDRV